MPLLLFFWFAFSTVAYANKPWSQVRYPLAGPPQAIGSYANGCIVGAVPLPLVGEGYQVMRVGRNRHHGHPQLIRWVERLGRYAAAQGRRLLIGDLGQPRGGPTPSDHRSHQNGLDADIWFLHLPHERVLSPEETEQLPMRSVVDLVAGTLNAYWSSWQRNVLRQAALFPEVDRIFVNALIKQALCTSETDRTWLRKVRPWWEHDAHFHVRLICPPDSPQCQPQEPLPQGDGCDANLANWVYDIIQAARFPKPRKRPEPPSADQLPPACDMILNKPKARQQ